MSSPTISSDVLHQFRTLDSEHVVEALKARLENEQIAQHFDVTDYQFRGSLIEVTKKNSILMRFTTLQDSHPSDYDSSAYKLLLLLGLRKERTFKTELQLELQDLTRKDNIDKTIIWTCEQLAATVIQSLKHVNTDSITITEKEVEQIRAINHFIPIRSKDYEYAVALNVAADLLLKRLKKLFHLVLSEVAAPIYDKLYGKVRVATNEMMKFEEQIVSDVTAKLKEQNRAKMAVDVGCGTGRHTFPLANAFTNVYAFDFSPRMIAQANHTKRLDNVTNVMFSVADLEYEEIVDEQKFYGVAGGKVNLVVASFGLASFIEDTPQMLRRFHSWLREDGLVILSFYNKQSIILQVTPNWRDTALSAHLDTERDTLRVELSPQTVFHIFCKPYSKEVMSNISAIFEIEKVYTYPTLMALMPNSLLQDQIALNLFKHVDEFLSENQDFPYGYYVTVVARKKSGDPYGATRVKQILKERGYEYDSIPHPPALSIDDVRRHISMDDGVAVKTVVFRYSGIGLILVVLPAEKRVDKKKLAAALHKSPGRLTYAPEREVLQLGFPIGGLAPFGFDPKVPLRKFIDEELMQTDQRVFYMGAGENRKTLKIKSTDFRLIVSDYELISL